MEVWDGTLKRREVACTYVETGPFVSITHFCMQKSTSCELELTQIYRYIDIL